MKYLFFSLHKIAKATDNFNIDNKIGEGGFGPVYKVTNYVFFNKMQHNYFTSIKEILGS